MQDFIKSYLQVIIDQKEWSWALIASVYFCLTLWIRNFYIKSIIKKAKSLDKKSYYEIKTNYLSQCGRGWFLFILSTSLVAFAWFRGITNPIGLEQGLMLSIAPLAFFLGLTSHLGAFNHATLSALKKSEETQKAF